MTAVKDKPTSRRTRQSVGGGAKKILYALNTIREIGVGKSAKALNAHNACKACALGMGGQKGGMTNEQGEFPAVCNKSVQAQSTDIQPAIPAAFFDFSVGEMAELSARDIEHVGRLGQPVHKAAGSDRYRVIDWEEAMAIAAARFAATEPDRSFFYSSGRSSNEAGFLLQFLARAYGTNNVNNCSYYCHQATGVALGSTIGTGTSTVELADIDESDLIFVIGANPASNHPRFIHKLAACRKRGGNVIIINPARESGLVRFALPKSPRSMAKGGDEIASDWLQPRIGGDLALFKGLAKAVIESGAQDTAYLAAHVDGADAFIADIESTPWSLIEQESGVAQADIERVAKTYAQSKAAIFAWGMGMTHHLNGCDNIEYIANLALLRGMIGRPGAGLLPLRGHSNVQGIGTIGVKPVLAEEVIERMEQRFGLELPRSKGMDTMASMKAADEGQIDAALLMGGNLFAANPDEAFSRRALGKVGFRLCLTTTFNHSHVDGVEDSEMLVLPVTARDEEWEPTTQESMFNFVRMSDGGISRLEHVRPESAILADLAARLLPDSGIDFSAFARHANLRRAIAAILPELADLADIDVAKQEFHIKGRLLKTPSFNTDNGRAKMQVRAIKSDPEAAAPSRDGQTFRLATVRSEGQFNSIVYEERDSYRGTSNRWCVMMNPDDLAALELAEDQTVTLSSSQGEMREVEPVPFDIARGSVLAYYPEANALTATDVDPRSRTPAFKNVEVSIRPSA